MDKDSLMDIPGWRNSGSREGAATNLRRPRATLARKVVPSFSMASFAMKPGHRRRAHEFITWPAFRTQRNISDRTRLPSRSALGFNLSSKFARLRCLHRTCFFGYQLPPFFVALILTPVENRREKGRELRRCSGIIWWITLN